MADPPSDESLCFFSLFGKCTASPCSRRHGLAPRDLRDAARKDLSTRDVRPYCKFFFMGECRNGDQCKSSHSLVRADLVPAVLANFDRWNKTSKPSATPVTKGALPSPSPPSTALTKLLAQTPERVSTGKKDQQKKPFQHKKPPSSPDSPVKIDWASLSETARTIALLDLLSSNEEKELRNQHNDEVLRVSFSKRSVQIAGEVNSESLRVALDTLTAIQAKIDELQQQMREFQSVSAALLTLCGSPSGMSPDKAEYLARRIFRERVRFKERLPFFAFRERLVSTVRQNQFVVLLGETGSGKSTQAAQYLLDDLNPVKKIVCTQPRRVAAISIARRLQEAYHFGEVTNVDVGENRQAIAKSKLIYRCLLSDRTLSGYSIVVLDEVHERTVETDILLALMKRKAAQDPTFRVVVTSATINTELFARYLNNCPVIRVPGRTYPIEYRYEERQADYVEHAVSKAISIHLREGPGDILVFLTAQNECEAACKRFLARAQPREAERLLVLPLHGKLPPEDQQEIFTPTPDGWRKVIFSTNIAETSVTINGVRYVVDTGLAKESRFDSARAMNVLELAAITQSSARQRAGRAGRTSSGICFRLYSEQDFENMQTSQTPEIARSDLSLAILKLVDLGERDIERFDFIESPPRDALVHALRSLEHMEAISSVKNSTLTPVGRAISLLERSPPFGRMILEGIKTGCANEVIIIAGMLSVFPRMFQTAPDHRAKAVAARPKWLHPKGDALSLLKLHQEWFCHRNAEGWCKAQGIVKSGMERAQDYIDEVKRAIKQNELGDLNATSSDEDTILRCVCSGFFNSISVFTNAKQLGYQILSNKQTAAIHPSSFVALLPAAPQWVVFTSVTQTARTLMNGISVIDPQWIPIQVPRFAAGLNIVAAAAEAAMARHSLRVSSALRALMLEKGPSGIRRRREYEEQLGLYIEEGQLFDELLFLFPKGRVDSINALRSDFERVSITISREMLYVSLEPSGVRIALGAGLEPLDLLEPGDTLTLRVCRLPDHARESDIINACGGTRAGVLSVKLRACDNTDENSDLQSSGTAYVNFASVQQAADTMAGFGGDSVRVCGSSCPVAFSLFFYGVSAIKAEGVITWFAAAKLPPPMATITFASAQALRNAIQTPLIVNGQSVVLSYPRIAKPEKHNAQAKNLPLSVDEVTLEEVCQQRYGRDFRFVRLARNVVPLPTLEKLQHEITAIAAFAQIPEKKVTLKDTGEQRKKEKGGKKPAKGEEFERGQAMRQAYVPFASVGALLAAVHAHDQALCPVLSAEPIRLRPSFRWTLRLPTALLPSVEAPMEALAARLPGDVTMTRSWEKGKNAQRWEYVGLRGSALLPLCAAQAELLRIVTLMLASAPLALPLREINAMEAQHKVSISRVDDLQVLITGVPASCKAVKQTLDQRATGEITFPSKKGSAGPTGAPFCGKCKQAPAEYRLHGCNHTFCLDCIRGDLRRQLSSPPLLCAACPAKIVVADLKAILPPNELVSTAKLTIAGLLTKRLLWRRCPVPACDGVLKLQNGEVQTCTQCANLVCMVCAKRHDLCGCSH